MSKWFSSSDAAITTSVIGLLAFVAYALLVFRYVLEELTLSITVATVETFIVLAIVGAWVWGLLLASSEDQTGWTILLISSLLPTLFALAVTSFTLSISCHPSRHFRNSLLAVTISVDSG